MTCFPSYIYIYIYIVLLFSSFLECQTAQIVILSRWELLLEHLYNLQFSFGSTDKPVQSNSDREEFREPRKEIEGIIEQLVSSCKKFLETLSATRDSGGGVTTVRR